MKLTKKHFELFRKECQKWIRKLKLDNWEVHYRWQESDSDRASIIAKLNGYIATVFLSKEWENYDKITDNDIKISAKHEIIHLLLVRFASNAKSRYITYEDLEESEEELVRKLEKII